MIQRDLTFICAYYLNAGMLAEQQRVWAAYPAELKPHLHVIVTDDGSPHAPAREVFAPTGLASQRLFRVEVDVRWNWLTCRNIGVHHATTEWVLLTDIDHVLPADTLRTLLTCELAADCVYRLSRADAPDRTPYKPHPNTWLLTRKMFDRIGGYDERFSGFYGSDSEFRERVHDAAREVVMLPQVMIRYPREVIPDASTTTYERKAKTDGVNVPRIKKERAALTDWRPLRLTFPYHLEASC